MGDRADRCGESRIWEAGMLVGASERSKENRMSAGI